jgi:DNA repair exonuclease SbcCD nuclease subunit
MKSSRVDSFVDSDKASGRTSPDENRAQRKLHSFAHLSDIHVGAFRDVKLQQMVIDAFERAMDICIERRVDFLVLSGDIFDSNFPDMGLVNSAVRKFKEVRDKGIRIYVVYGSHDFSPTQTSIIDVLESAGLFVKLPDGRLVNDKLVLSFILDDTGAKLCGISGRKSGMENEDFAKLELGRLEEEEGLKIFALHGAIREFLPDNLAQIEAIPLSAIPKSFDYYAAGHLHEKSLKRQISYGLMAYPGALFGADYRDLEATAKGLERGFFTITFSNKIENIDFERVSVCVFALLDYDANGKSPGVAQTEIVRMVEEAEVAEKVVLLKARGELATGKTSDIDFHRIRKLLEERGARHVSMNYHLLTSREYAQGTVDAQDAKEIETKLFAEGIRNVTAKSNSLRGALGTRLSISLLESLRQERKENETKNDYEGRVIRRALNLLNVKDGE